MSDFYEDLADEMGRPGIQPEDGDLISEKELKAMLRNKVYTLPRPYVTEEDM
jgi:hypothetical protein